MGGVGDGVDGGVSRAGGGGGIEVHSGLTTPCAHGVCCRSAFEQLVLMSAESAVELLPTGSTTVRVASDVEGPHCGLIPLGACGLPIGAAGSCSRCVSLANALSPSLRQASQWSM